MHVRECTCSAISYLLAIQLKVPLSTFCDANVSDRTLPVLRISRSQLFVLCSSEPENLSWEATLPGYSCWATCISHMDFLRPYQKLKSGNQCIIVLKIRYTKLNGPTDPWGNFDKRAAMFIDSLVILYWIPKYPLTKNRLQFASKFFCCSHRPYVHQPSDTDGLSSTSPGPSETFLTSYNGTNNSDNISLSIRPC